MPVQTLVDASESTPMTVEEAVGCFTAALIEGWMEAINEKDGEKLHDIWMRRLHGVLALQVPTPPKRYGEEAVFQMRDEFLQLAKCYLDIRNYDAALSATEMAKLLERFEAKHTITRITWPAIVERSENQRWLEGNEDTADGA